MESMNLISNSIPLQELLRKYHVGEYQLPAFQRPYIWRPRQMLNLLDSLLRGYPISVIYLWKPGPNSKLVVKPQSVSKTKVGPPKVERFEAFIVDGQQRLTSLHAAFGFAETLWKNNRSLECWLELVGPDDRDGRITRLFQCPAQKLYLKYPEQQQKPWRVRLRDILETPYYKLRSDRADQLKMEDYGLKEIEEALNRIDKAYEMLKTPITCITITQSDDAEVLQVFKRLNRGGTGLQERNVKAADLGIGKSVEVLRQMQFFVNATLRLLGASQTPHCKTFLQSMPCNASNRTSSASVHVSNSSRKTQATFCMPIIMRNSVNGVPSGWRRHGTNGWT